MLPLLGKTVLDFSAFLSGPYCTMLLADLGAEVIRIERPGKGEVYRTYGPKYINGESTSFLAVGRNKKSISLDIKNPSSREILRRLIANADILVQNMKPGIMDKNGLGYSQVREINPRMIYCSISGFGSTGPYRERGGFDLVAQGMSGLMSVTGESNGNPVKVGFPVTDMLAGTYAAVGIMAALLEAAETGKGKCIDVSLLEAAVSLGLMAVTNYYADGEIQTRMGSASPQNAPYQGFAARDGYFTVGTGNDELWRRFCQVFELEFLLDDPRFTTNALRVKNQDELASLIQPRLQMLTLRDCMQRLLKAEIPYGPIYNLAEMLSDPHIQARNTVIEVPQAQGGTFKTLGLPFKMSDLDSRREAPPQLGEHNNIVLETLGFTKQEICEFQKNGVM